jgi:hypothetical protein
LHGRATPESCSELGREFRVIRALSTDTRFEARTDSSVLTLRCTDRCVPPRAPWRHGSNVRLVSCASCAAATLDSDSFRRIRRDNVSRAIAAVMPHAGRCL